MQSVDSPSSIAASQGSWSSCSRTTSEPSSCGAWTALFGLYFLRFQWSDWWSESPRQTRLFASWHVLRFSLSSRYQVSSYLLSAYWCSSVCWGRSHDIASPMGDQAAPQLFLSPPRLSRSIDVRSSWVRLRMCRELGHSCHLERLKS